MIHLCNTFDTHLLYAYHLQKLYRFINTVELVSPHHSAKEIMSSLRTGQITSLFQKSLKKVSHLENLEMKLN